MPIDPEKLIEDGIDFLEEIPDKVISAADAAVETAAALADDLFGWMD